MITLFRKTYKTYRGDSSYHRVRLALFVIVSAFIANYGVDTEKLSFPTISLAISVLAGFSFTALFSSYSLTITDLPDPKNENDRKDKKTLRILIENFQFRSQLFIALSVVDLVAIFLCSTPIYFEFRYVLSFISSEFVLNILDVVQKYFQLLWDISLVFLRFLVIILFFECLYKFSRLAETIIAILDIRREYLDSSEGS